MQSVAILERLIAFPTVSRDPNLDLIDFVRELLADAGIDGALVPDADRAQGEPLRHDRAGGDGRGDAVGAHRRGAGRRPGLDGAAVRADRARRPAATVAAPPT